MPESPSTAVLQALNKLLNDPGVRQWVTAEEQVKIRSLAVAEDQIEVVYERPEVEFVVGLRIAVQAGRDPASEAARILIGNVNEPLGSYYETMEVDSQGVHWWAGEPAEWWDQRTWEA